MNLGIGTAQFGMVYGISNRDGQTPPGEAAAIIRFAASAGISVIDTAHGYGESETVLGGALMPGHPFRIVTKTPAFPSRPVRPEDAADLERSFLGSLTKLGQRSIAGLLLHSADDLLAPGGERLHEKLIELKERRLVDKIGASVYSGEQVDALLGRYPLDLIQAPVSVLDQRLIASGRLAALKQQGVEVHARSIFLQGLLLMSPEDAPSYFEPLRPMLRRYRDAVREHGLTPEEAAFCFITGVKEIDQVIIGVNRLDQLRSNVTAFRKTFAAGTRAALAAFSIDDPKFLNPAFWRLHAA